MCVNINTTNHDQDYILVYLGYERDNYFIGYKTWQKPIPLLIFKDHCMIHNEYITFKCLEYKNTYQFLKLLINDRTLKRKTICEKGTMMNAIEKNMLLK